MTRLPSNAAARNLIDSLRALNEPPKPKHPLRIDTLERRLLAALERDRTGSPLPDGYPRGTLGGGGSSEGSSVEAAVIALDEATCRDRHHDLVTRAVTSLEDAIVAVNIATAALDSLDDLTKTTGPTPKTCAHCTPHRPEASAQPVHRRGTVGDRLDVALDLCQACYFFAVRTADAGSHAGSLPDPQQIAHHERTGYWKIRATAAP